MTWVVKWRDGSYLEKAHHGWALWSSRQRDARRFETKDEARVVARMWETLPFKPRIVRLTRRS